VRKRGAARKKPAPRGPIARLPLPKKGEKLHADRTKYDRRREKARLRRDLDTRRNW
jgi:hypothetical protein